MPGFFLERKPFVVFFLQMYFFYKKNCNKKKDKYNWQYVVLTQHKYNN